MSKYTQPKVLCCQCGSTTFDSMMSFLWFDIRCCVRCGWICLFKKNHLSKPPTTTRWHPEELGNMFKVRLTLLRHRLEITGKQESLGHSLSSYTSEQLQHRIDELETMFAKVCQ